MDLLTKCLVVPPDSINNLEDCVAFLINRFSAEDLLVIQNNMDMKSISLHSGLGRWLRNRWGLWDATLPLSKYFKEQGLLHPDDMSDLIISAFFAKVRNQEFSIQGYIEESNHMREICCKAK